MGWKYLVLGLVGTSVCLLVKLAPLWDLMEDRVCLILNCVAHFPFTKVENSYRDLCEIDYCCKFQLSPEIRP